MRRYALPFAVTVAFVVALVLDDGFDGLAANITWVIAWADFLLVGWLLGWLLARLTPNWNPPAFFRSLDIFTRPEERNG